MGAKEDKVVKLNGQTGRPLLWFDQCPPELQFNRYIRSGYRAGYTCRECVASIFQYHNETGNILVHLLPALVLLGGLLTQRLPHWELATYAFYENVLPILGCLAGSVTYHTFMANHERYRCWLAIDVAGVFLLLVMSMHTSLWWGMSCHPLLAYGFIIAYYSVAVFCIFAGLTAKTQVGRAAPMLLLLSVRVASCFTRFTLDAGSRSAIWHYIAMEAYSVAGAVINVLRIPEKWLFPAGGPLPNCRTAGFFDYWLNSHQLMHILILGALVHFQKGAFADYRFYHYHERSCRVVDALL